MAEQAKEEKTKQPLPLWRRLLIIFIIGAMVLLGGSMAAGYILQWQLGREISKVPAANEIFNYPILNNSSLEIDSENSALSYYSEALGVIMPESLENIIKSNKYYINALGSIPSKEIPRDIHSTIAKEMIKFQQILSRFDKSSDLPLPYYDIGIEKGMENCTNQLQKVRTAVFLMSLRTLDLTSRHKYKAAVYSTASTMRTLRVLDSYPTMTVNGVKTGLIGLACEDIRLLLEYGNLSDDLLQILDQALNETVESSDLRKSFLAERTYQLAIARNLLPQKLATEYLQDRFVNMPGVLMIPESTQLKLRTQLKSIEFFKDLNRLISTSDKPWPGPIDAADKFTDGSSRLIESGSKFIALTADTSAITESTLTAIAIERYRKKNGKLPESLSELVPDYLTTAPVDPYTGDQLHYINDERGYTIYSNGSNRIDDGGKIERRADKESPLDRGIRINFRK